VFSIHDDELELTSLEDDALEDEDVASELDALEPDAAEEAVLEPEPGLLGGKGGALVATKPPAPVPPPQPDRAIPSKPTMLWRLIFRAI
jgi:hypothetical protein